MARQARLTYPGLPHHVTQRGNRRAPIFFDRGDQRSYLHFLTEQCEQHGVEVWAYCLMPNHVHLIMTPRDGHGLSRAIGEAHRRYTSLLNGRHGWTGHLFQGRYFSAVMDERHLIAAARYLALNPVRAGLVERAADWPWSSVHAHLLGRDGRLVRVRPLLDRIERFAEFIETDPGIDATWAREIEALRRATKLGRPVGEKAFVEGLGVGVAAAEPEVGTGCSRQGRWIG